jgi:hypothetical protein
MSQTSLPFLCNLLFRSFRWWVMSARNAKSHNHSGSDNFSWNFCFSVRKISISWRSSKKRLINFPILSHLIYSASISNKNCWNCRWLSAEPLMKFTVDTTIFMTDSKFVTLLHTVCWCMMQCNCKGGLKFEHSISVLMRVTPPELHPTMLFAPSVVTQQSSFQFKWRLLRVSQSFWKYLPQSWFPSSSEAQLILQLFKILHRFLGRI